MFVDLAVLPISLSTLWPSAYKTVEVSQMREGER